MNQREIIEKAWDNRELLKEQSTQDTIKEIVDLVDKGELRVAEPTADGWQTNDWVKKAIILYFPMQQMSVQEVGIFEYHDKMKLKTGYDKLGVRVVPPAVARYGAYLAKNVVS